MVVAAHDILRLARDGALEHPIVFRVARHRVQQLGNLDHPQKTQIIGECFGNLFR